MQNRNQSNSLPDLRVNQPSKMDKNISFDTSIENEVDNEGPAEQNRQEYSVANLASPLLDYQKYHQKIPDKKQKERLEMTQSYAFLKSLKIMEISQDEEEDYEQEYDCSEIG